MASFKKLKNSGVLYFILRFGVYYRFNQTYSIGNFELVSNINNLLINY